MGENRVALLAAPVRMRKTTEYFAAFRLAKECHPQLRIIADEELWSTAREFHQTYKKQLSSFVVSNFYVLTAFDGTVGRGIFDMWRYLRKHQNSKITALFPIGNEGSFEEIEECELSVIGEDTGRYAVPVESTSSATA